MRLVLHRPAEDLSPASKTLCTDRKTSWACQCPVTRSKTHWSLSNWLRSLRGLSKYRKAAICTFSSDTRDARRAHISCPVVKLLVKQLELQNAAGLGLWRTGWHWVQVSGVDVWAKTLTLAVSKLRLYQYQSTLARLTDRGSRVSASYYEIDSLKDDTSDLETLE